MLDPSSLCGGIVTPQLDRDQVKAWLDTLYGDTSGYINIVSTDNWTGQSFRDTGEATRYVELVDKRKPKGLYVRMTSLRQPLLKGRGGVADTREVIGYWADMDIEGPGHKWHVCPTGSLCPQRLEDEAAGKRHTENFVPLIPDEAACLRIIEASGLPAPTEWVASGGGYYPIWLFANAQDTGGDPAALEMWGGKSADLQRVIELTARNMGFHYGAGVGNLDRVLRIPGTVNRKVDDSPTMCEWRMDLSTSQPYEAGRMHRAISEQLLILAPKVEPPKPAVITSHPKPNDLKPQGLLPGEDYAARNSWRQILEADGCQVFKERGDYIEWTRPDKKRSNGGSGTTNHAGNDLLKVFSDAWQPLQDGKTYTKFGYYCEVHHNGNFNEATKALSALGYGERKFERPVAISAPEWVTEAAGFTAADAPTEAQLAAGVIAAFENGTKGVTGTPKRQSGTPTFSFTESGFADRLTARYGDDFRFVASRDRNAWLRWENGIWKTDKRNTVMNLVDRLVQEAYARAAEVAEDEKGKLAYQKSLHPMLKRSGQSGAAGVFSARPPVALEADELDAVRHKVVCGNGVVDLSDLSFGPHDRTLLATKKLGIDYQAGATAPKWEKFLSEVLPDPSVRDYLQRIVGYTLTGNADLKAIVMFHGTGNCGKGQVVNALTEVFGGLSASVKEQTLVINDSATAATPGLQKLRGARLVTGSETREGAKLDEALLKKLAGGGDLVESRGLWADEESWKPQFTLFLATNFLPKFNADDDAIWRRVKPIHFTQLFGGDGLPEVLDIGRKLVAEEGPGILNWILEGLKRYREIGLADNEAVKQGVAAYQRDSDPVARFLDEAINHGDLVTGEDAKIESKQLYSWFSQWCLEEGIKFPLVANRFGRRLTTLGYQRTKNASGDVRMWAGLSPGESRWLIGGSATRF